MPRKREAPKRHDIEIEYDKKIYRGQYAEAAGGVSVFYESRDKWGMFYGGPAEQFARLLLRELVKERLANHEPRK